MRNRVPALVLMMAALGAEPGWSTTLYPLSLEQLSQASSAVVRGRVVSQESRWNSARTTIVTYTTIAVEQTLKGLPPGTLVIEQPGGAVGNIRVRVPGTMAFESQARYFLFLEPAMEGSPSYRLVGMVQGAYRVFRDSRTGEERVLRPLGGLFYGRRQSGVRGTVATTTVREFRQQLSRAVTTPMVIPRGTSLSLVIRATEFRGAGRVRVLGRTTTEVFPSSSAVVPVGSSVEGVGELHSGSWRIRWKELSIRGVRVPITALSEEPADGPLRGRVLAVNVR